MWIGQPLAFLDAQKVVWERHLSPAGPLGGLIAAVQDREILDLAVVAVVVIALGVVAWRRIGVAVRTLRPRQRRAAARRRTRTRRRSSRCSGSSIVAFPAFMALATVVRSRRATLVTAAILAAGLVVYVVRWALWYWVA